MPRNHEQATEEIDPREVTLAYLERRREEWLPLYRRAERDGRMNARLNAEADAAFKPIDDLLEELHALGGAAVSNVIRLDQSA